MANNKRHGRHRKDGRTTPKGTRPGHLHLVPNAQSVLDDCDPLRPGPFGRAAS